jgi:hypothetical protein
MTEQILHLPVSGLDVCLRSLTGMEDLLLSETTVLDTRLAISLLSGMVQPADGSAIALENLTIADLDTLLLLTRKTLFGDLIRADATCPADHCGARIEVAFQVENYLAHERPRKVRGVEPGEEIRWFRFQNLPVSFRLPTGADQVAIAYHAHPEQALIQRCVRPSDLPAKQRKRVERAMEAMAPSLVQLLQGQCAECSTIVEILFDPQQFVLQELQNQARFVYEDIHLLAMYYQWSEAEILGLPRSRRIYYAERIRQTQKSA